jgi:hypothetical protein
MWSCHRRDDLVGRDEAACCHSPVVLRYGPVPGKPRTNNTPCAWNLAELLSLRVHAGGPEPPPLGANSAVATTSTSPSPALAHSPAHALSHLFRLVAPSCSSHLYPRTLVFLLLSHRPRGTQAAHTIMSTRQRTSGSHLGYTPAQGPAMGLVPGATRAPQIEAT